ncbi:MAG: AAA family ATPase, partial [Candidatus Limnocylindria bacterium]
QERQVSVDGETRPIPAPFLVLATQNPVELEGTFALPEAQLDRFLVRVVLGYPEETDERSIARRYRAADEPLEAVRVVMDPAALPEIRDATRQVTVSEEVEAYLVRIVRATRVHADLQLGASPRASVALYRAAQASAFLEGRDFVLPDDVSALAGPVLTHRLVVDVERELRGATADDVIGEVLDGVSVGVGTGAGTGSPR